MAPASKAQQKAVAKYMENNYDELKVRMPKGKKDIIKTAAENQGKSINGFIMKLLTRRLKKKKNRRI